MWQKLFNRSICCLASLNHDQNLARGFQGIHEFFNSERACQVLALRFLEQIMCLLGGTIIYRDREAFAFNVKSQVFAHYGQTNNTNLLFCHLVSHPLHIYFFIQAFAYAHAITLHFNVFACRSEPLPVTGLLVQLTMPLRDRT